MTKPLLLFVGPSGSGKTTIANMMELECGYHQVQSYTTRKPRYKGETGHIFISNEDFDRLGEFAAYTVYNGNKYGTTVSEIKNLNNLSTNNLSIGQTLKIPSDGQITYVVKSGDNLYSIAAKYNTSVNAIKQKNNLTSNNLSIGQILII